MTLTDLTAIVALFMALASLGWQVWTYISDKGHLVLSGSIGHRTNPNGVGNRLAAAIIVANAGRRPIYVGNLCYMESNGDYSYCQFADEVVGKIESTEWRQAMIVATNIIDDDVVGFFAMDGLGRRYPLPKEEFKRLKAELKSEQERLAALGWE